MVLEEKLEKELKETLKKKKALFEEILKISELQEKWIQMENWKRFMNATNTKQDKIEKINAFNHVLKQIEPDYKNLQNIKLRPQLEEINEVIYKIQAKENENINAIKKIMKDDKKVLKDIQLKKTVNTAYSNIKGIQKDGCFIDKFK